MKTRLGISATTENFAWKFRPEILLRFSGAQLRVYWRINLGVFSFSTILKHDAITIHWTVGARGWACVRSRGGSSKSGSVEGVGPPRVMSRVMSRSPVLGRVVERFEYVRRT